MAQKAAAAQEMSSSAAAAASAVNHMAIQGSHLAVGRVGNSAFPRSMVLGQPVAEHALDVAAAH